MGSVSIEEADVAWGTNSAVRELGGVFGVAVLAAVFAHAGAYETPQLFVDGFSQALWVGAALSVGGIVAALLAPVKGSTQEAGAAVGAHVLVAETE